jgi:hypothetical protein
VAPVKMVLPFFTHLATLLFLPAKAAELAEMDDNLIMQGT